MVWSPRASARLGTAALEGHCPAMPGGGAGAGALSCPIDRGRKGSSPQVCPCPPAPLPPTPAHLPWFPPQSCRAWSPCLRQTEEAFLSDPQVFLEFTYLLVAAHFGPLCSSRNLRVGSSEGKQNKKPNVTLLRDEGSGKKSVLFFEAAKCSEKLHFYGIGSC